LKHNFDIFNYGPLHMSPVNHFHFRSMRISFISKVTRVHKATTVVNDASLYSTILVVFLGFHPGRPGWNFPYEQTTKLVPVTEPARLPGSYEEALGPLIIINSTRSSQHCLMIQAGKTKKAPYRHLRIFLKNNRQLTVFNLIVSYYTDLNISMNFIKINFNLRRSVL